MEPTNVRVTVNVDIPHSLVTDMDVSSLGAELRRLWAVDQVRRGRLGVGRAAEVAEMPRAAFMQLLGEHGVPVISYAPEDFQQEFRAVNRR